MALPDDKQLEAAVGLMRKRFPDATVDDIAAIARCNELQLDTALSALQSATTLAELRTRLDAILRS